MGDDKKIILVLNKIDLVPLDVVNSWVKVLRREFAVVPFKGNTQNQESHLSSVSLFKKSLTGNEEIAKSMLESSKAVGPDQLLQLIKNYSKFDGVKQAVTVGVFGYPNVGKSSLINSLIRKKSAGVSSTPGFTKKVQEIILDSKVKLLDCPGVVFSEGSEAEKVIRNIIKVDTIHQQLL